MRRPPFGTGIALLVLAIASDPANAQETRDARPDWAGYYTLASARDLAGTGFKQDFPGEELNKLRTFSVLLLLGVRTTRI
jgi:hypothetical protein